MRFPCTLFSPKSEETLDDASSSNRVGHSVFYDCIDASPACVEEKQDAMKPEKPGDTTDEEGELAANTELKRIILLRRTNVSRPTPSLVTVSEIDQGCTIFSGVTYLGAANINAPKSEGEVYRIMCELNSGSKSVGLKITVSIPNCSDGLVV